MEDKNQNDSNSNWLQVSSSAEELKEKGNKEYRAGNFSCALDNFSEAISLVKTIVEDYIVEAGDDEATTEKVSDSDIAVQKERVFQNYTTYLVNRSLCYAALKNWKSSMEEANKVVKISHKHQKAHFRLVKALIMLEDFKKARISLLYAFKHCGESKELKTLEEEIASKCGVAARPKSSDFEILSEIGNGNFSTVYKASHKKTSRTYAIKAIERATVERMKRRHPNIHNEILMEKRVLNKLAHSGIVELYSTFQDSGTLFYQMEYVEGGELWGFLHEVAGKSTGENNAQVGCHWSQAIFFLTEIIDALEFMHKLGVVHRDLKPENIIITASGHIKIIDFGTAKDLVQTDLNGQEFVGTPEFMSPRTVKSKAVAVDADLWALGIILYQMLFGLTPFRAASPYLVFLRIQKGRLKFHSSTPQSIREILQVLLTLDPNQRIALATGGWKAPAVASSTKVSSKDGEKETEAGTEAASESSSLRTSSATPSHSSSSVSSLSQAYASISYNALREQPIFTDRNILNNRKQHNEQQKLADQNTATTTTSTATTDGTPIIAASASTVPVRVPALYELCLRAVGDTCLKVAELTALNGGIRPKVPWIQAFAKLSTTLNPLERGRVTHYLQRKNKLHLPGVFRLFHENLVDSRALRADPSTRDYVGLTYALQGHWDKNFYFAHLSNPLFGCSDSRSRRLGDSVIPVGSQLEHLNPMPPAPPGSGQEALTGQTPAPVTAAAPIAICTPEAAQLRQAILATNKLRPKFVVMIGNFTSYNPLTSYAKYDQAMNEFRKAMARFTDTIPVAYVPGSLDVGVSPTPWSLQQYRQRLGADYFAFWFGGLRCIVLNSPLMVEPSGAEEESAEQDRWFEEEIEQSKLCSTHMVVFTWHPWFQSALDEDHNPPPPPPPQESDGDGDGTGICAVSSDTYIPRDVRMKWVKKLRHHKVQYLFSSTSLPIEGRRSGQRLSKQLRPYPKKKDKEVRWQPAEEQEEGKRMVEEKVEELSSEDSDVDLSEMKPSEMITAAVHQGELSAEDVRIGQLEEETAGVRGDGEGNATTNDSGDGNGSDSDSGGVGEDEANDEECSEDGEPRFLNEEADYEGPVVMQLSSLVSPVGSEQSVVQVTFVEEFEMECFSFDVDGVDTQGGRSFPKSPAELLNVMNKKNPRQ